MLRALWLFVRQLTLYHISLEALLIENRRCCCAKPMPGRSSAITHATQPKKNRVFAHHAARLVLVRKKVFALAGDRFQLLEHRNRLLR